ncbi:MAG: ABC transporter permease [Candidatus Hodarchaeales archaeon]|jgi:ABC-2 type transport system permease protein
MVLATAEQNRIHGRKAWWSQFWAMTKKEFTVLTRYKFSFVLSFVQIMVIMFVFTVAAMVLAPPDQESFGVGIMFYSFILFMFFSTALWDIGNSLREEQYQGTLESLFMSPISYFSTLVSRILSNVIWTSLNVAIAFIFMSIVFGKLPVQNVFLGMIILVLSLFVCFGFSFGFAGLALQYKESMNTLTNFLQFFFMIVCAMFFPFSALPDIVLIVSRLIPLSYCVDLFRSTLIGIPPELLSYELEFGVVTFFAIVFPLLGIMFFRRTVTTAKRSGTLAEY